MEPEVLKSLIEETMPGSEARVRGDGRHFEVLVISADFAGKGTLQRHRSVYAALGDSFQTDAVHAVSLKTCTPEEAPGG